MEPLYRLVFNGELAPGADGEAAVTDLAKRFRLQESTARDLIQSGNRRVLKRDLGLQNAQRYRSALEQTGLIVVLERQDEPGGALELEPGVAADQVVPEVVVGQDAVPVPGATFCPKCGAVAVSPLTGVCESCGVVAERFLARQAADQPGGARDTGRADNPYAPPQADLTPPPSEAAGDSLYPPRSVPAGRGWGWVADAWPLFKDCPWAWIGAFLVYALVMIALSFVPLLGTLATMLLGPILTAGLMIGAHVQHGGGRFEIGHLFAGFSRSPGRLALVGAAYLGAALLVGLVVGVGVFGVLATTGGALNPEALEPNAMDPDSMANLGAMVLLPVLVALLIGIPIAMAILFAPALVALNDVPVLGALKLSFLGCWRNILPFLVYGLVALGLAFVGSIPFGLGLLVVFPLLTIAIYVAYRDIFYR